MRLPATRETSGSPVIDALQRPPTSSDLDQLAQLLADAVDSGASVSFMRPFSVDSAREWCRTTLDRVRGDAAEQLHMTAGWQRVGVIADYALYPDGRPCDTVVFYKKV